MRWLMKAPAYLYRAGLGWMMGKRMAMIEHVGRRSGRTYQTVLEVVRYDNDTIDLAAAWGPKSDWFRNIKANPAVTVSSGRIHQAPATGRVVDAEAAAEVYAAYTEAHPRSVQALSKALGLPFEDPAVMAASVPLVRLTLDASAG